MEPGFTDDDLGAVARAYREKRAAGELDFPAYNAALRVYRERHSEAPEQEAREIVARIIFETAERDGTWFYGR